MSAGDVRKILILRFSSLGDIVMTTAVPRVLRARYPTAQIDMVVGEEYLDLILHNPYLDGKIGFSRKSGSLRQLLRRLNREGYDLVYDAHRSLRTAALMPWLRARHKTYLHKHYLRRNLTLLTKLPLWKDRTRLLERHTRALAPFGVAYDGRGPEVFLASSERGACEVAPSIGLIPSAQWPGKRWPPDRFHQLAKQLLERTPFSLVVFGGKDDTFCGDIVAGLDKRRIFNKQGRLSLLEAASELKACTFVIANDTGLLHVADAVGRPSIVLMGPTSALMGCLPFHPLSRVMEQSLWCRPCSANGQAPCIRSKRYCLEKTTVRDVLSSALSLVEELKGAA